ncbi:Targeting protein for Xklp2 (TPX2) [Musa troglodytarum]|uniref:Targeting protein for Xklp2 (TPX2) n=1 Tax=Musa troglodytarum TaxID=320322 RepID=A0A9E7GBP0_9LILI|nr:Targeting protein for Xklp2 (TPX2) [Musa troglodytarum]
MGSHQAQENHVAALGGSISFGRFLSESLDWGKWSSFHHNRHLEEVEKYSVPGSVARKKAYFEAHYKRVAAKKEAANAATRNIPERQTDVAGFVESEKKSNRLVDQGACFSRAGVSFDLCEVAEVEKGNAIEEDKIHNGSSLQLEATDAAVEEGEQEESEEKSTHTADNSRKGISFDLCDKSNEPQVAEAEKGNAIEGDEIHIGSSLHLEPTDVAVEDIESKNKFSGFEPCEICTSEKKPLKESLVINMDNIDSAEKKFSVTVSRSSVSLRSSGLPPSPASRIPFSPSRLVSSLRCPKENISTPSSNWKCGSISKENKKSGPTFPKSLCMSVNPKAKMSPVHEKVKETKATVNSAKPSPDLSRHHRTPYKVSLDGVPRVNLVIIQSEKKRNSNDTGSRACRETASFSLTTRAGGSIELKKEKSFESKKLHQNYHFKARSLPEFYRNAEPNKKERTEKTAESEQNKLQHTHGFKARPLPEFYHNINPTKSGVKISSEKPHSRACKDH